MPQGTLWSDSVVMWHSDIGDVVINGFGTDVWEAAELKAKAGHGFIDGVKRKNSMLIAATLDELFKNGKQSQVLETLCSKILQYADKH